MKVGLFFGSLNVGYGRFVIPNVCIGVNEGNTSLQNDPAFIIRPIINYHF